MARVGCFRGRVLFCLLLLLGNTAHSAGGPEQTRQLTKSGSTKPLRVAFIDPSSGGDPYWDRYVEFMQVAAKSLGIEFTVEYAEGNRMNTPKIAKHLIEQDLAPDYLIYIFQNTQTYKVLKQAEKHGVRSFIVNTNVIDFEREAVGKPRQHFKHWIGHLHSDNIKGGTQLAKGLVALARKKGLVETFAPVNTLAFSGSRDSTAALDYNIGLNDYVSSAAQMFIEQLVFTNWSFDAAQRQAKGLMLRYPETKIMWTVGENVALGVLDGLRHAGREAGKDVVVGGTVSTARGVNAILSGKMIANMGGDAWEGARALVMIYDYHFGKDFAKEEYSVLYSTELVTQENVQPYVHLINEERWREIDYRKLSKAYTDTPLEFTVDGMLEAAGYTFNK